MRTKNVFYFTVYFSVIFFSKVGAQHSTQEKIDSLYTLANSIKAKAGDSLKIVTTNLIKLSKQEGNETGLVKGKLMRSLYLINRMKLDSAKQLLNECESYFKSDTNKARSIEAALYNYLHAVITMRRNQFAEAEMYAAEAMKNYKLNKNDKGIAAVFLQLGNIKYLQENYSEALDFYSQALKHKMSAGLNVSAYEYELNKIADIYTQMGQYDKALVYLRRSYAPKASSINNSNLFKLMGNIHKQMNDLDSAMYYYQKAKHLISPTEDKANHAGLDLDIAEVTALQGYLKEANSILLNVLAQNNPSHLMLNSRIWSQLALNYLKLNKLDSALYFGRKAYQSVEGKGMKHEVINSAYVMAEIFKVRAKFDSAYHFTTIYHQNKDSLFNTENQRKLSSLYAEIETLGKQKEIETLEKQNQIDQVRNRNLILAIVLGSISFISFLVSVILFYRNKQKKQILNNLVLQQDLDRKNKDLHNQAVKMIYMNNSFVEIEESLKRLNFQSQDSAKDVRQLLSNLQLNKSLEKEWDNFNLYFGTVHGNFFDKIKNDFPELSTSEKRLASLIRMNMTNREIASILNIESSSVKIAKYRLKKKLNLNEEVDIQSFLQSLN